MSQNQHSSSIEMNSFEGYVAIACTDTMASRRGEGTTSSSTMENPVQPSVLYIALRRYYAFVHTPYFSRSDSSIVFFRVCSTPIDVTALGRKSRCCRWYWFFTIFLIPTPSNYIRFALKLRSSCTTVLFFVYLRVNALRYSNSVEWIYRST